jgi:hypothetical protein
VQGKALGYSSELYKAQQVQSVNNTNVSTTFMAKSNIKVKQSNQYFSTQLQLGSKKRKAVIIMSYL